MIYNKRKIGQTRPNRLFHHSIYKNLGHPFDIKNKDVIFIGNKEKTYCLTKNKTYKILNYKRTIFNYDYDLINKFKNISKDKIYASQSDDYFIIIINDKGNKRKYPHQMFKIK